MYHVSAGLRQCIITDQVQESKKRDAGDGSGGSQGGQNEDADDEFTRLLREQLQADAAIGRRSTVLTCPAGIT